MSIYSLPKKTRKIRIKNFRSLVMEDFIEIKPITLFFGKNGSGKSSFIKAIKFLSNNLPVTSDQTSYHISRDLDLGNFNQIVTGNDLKKKISIEIEEHWEIFEKNLPPTMNFRISAIFKAAKDDKNFESLVISNLNDKSELSIFPLKKNINRDTSKINNLGLISTVDSEVLLGKIPPGGNSYPDLSIDIDRMYTPTNLEWLSRFVGYLDILPFVEHSENLNFSYYKLLFKYLNFNSKQVQVAENLIFDYVHLIPRLANKLLNSWYVTPVREKPQTNYPLFGNSFNRNDYNGILSQLDSRRERYVDYNNGMFDLQNFLNEQISFLGIGHKIYIKKSSGTGGIYIADQNGVEHNLSESSSGLIQLLPILVQAYNALYNYEDQLNFWYTGATDILFIEQPELHLHPSLQTKLVEFFNKGLGTYILETHSEHIVKKIQVLVSQAKLNRENVAIYYFEKDNNTGVTSIQEMELQPNGFFKTPWPNGFFDDNFNLSLDLLAGKN